MLHIERYEPLRTGASIAQMHCHLIGPFIQLIVGKRAIAQPYGFLIWGTRNLSFKQLDDRLIRPE
jgi:hypothetical protein